MSGAVSDPVKVKYNMPVCTSNICPVFLKINNIVGKDWKQPTAVLLGHVGCS